MHFSNLENRHMHCYFNIDLYCILDHHHKSQSLDPTLDIWSNFVKKKRKFKYLQFATSFSFASGNSSGYISSYLSRYLSSNPSLYLSCYPSCCLSSYVSIIY